MRSGAHYERRLDQSQIQRNLPLRARCGRSGPWWWQLHLLTSKV